MRKRITASKFVLYSLIGFLQFIVWILGAYIFMSTQLDQTGRYLSYLNSTIFTCFWLAGILCVPLLFKGITPTTRGLKGRERLNAVCTARVQDLIHACISPCVILIGILAVTGLPTPWVLLEPLLWSGLAESIEQKPPEIPNETVAIVAPRIEGIRKMRLNGEDVVELTTPMKNVCLKSNHVESAKLAVIAVGGVGGDFDSPAQGLYGRLADSLKNRQILVLDVSFEDPGDLEKSVYDLRAAIRFVIDKGIDRIVLIGHSFGGGVVIYSAIREPKVCSVIALSSQTIGSEEVEKLAPCSLMLIHGFFDYAVPRYTSLDLYRRAKQPKELKIVMDGHLLDLCANQVFDLAIEQIKRALDSKKEQGTQSQKANWQ